MSEKAASAIMNISVVTLDKVHEFISQPYNYQEATNVSSSSISIDMRNTPIEKESSKGLETIVTSLTIRS